MQLLDVSLRDGGHRIDFNFNTRVIKQILTALDFSGVDYIELGYRNGFFSTRSGIGAAGLCPNEYLLSCRKLIQTAKLAVMVHPGNVDETDLKEIKNCGVDLIRICLLKEEVAKVLPLIRLCHQLGLMVSVNVIHISQYQLEELDKLIALLVDFNPEMIYFADSNGSLLPEKVAELFAFFCQRYPVAFGFHAHDNLGLAQANSLAALRHGAKLIDASLAGMGKGTGNLKLEFIAPCLQAMNEKNYQFHHLITAANYLRRALHFDAMPLEMDEFLRGLHDLSTAQLRELKNASAGSSNRSK